MYGPISCPIIKGKCRDPLESMLFIDFSNIQNTGNFMYTVVFKREGGKSMRIATDIGGTFWT